jgi:hypothetical protein
MTTIHLTSLLNTTELLLIFDWHVTIFIVALLGLMIISSVAAKDYG